MLANILYILSVILPVMAAWAHDSYAKLQAVKVEQAGAEARTRLAYNETNIRAKTAEHENALTNALLSIQEQSTLIAELKHELADHAKQLSLLNDRV